MKGVGGVLDAENGNLGNNISNAINQLCTTWTQERTTCSGQGVIDSCADTAQLQQVGAGCARHWLRRGARPQPDNQSEDPDHSGLRPGCCSLPPANIRIVNLLGFFIDAPMAAPPSFDLRGILVLQPGLFSAGFGEVPSASSFLKIIQLIR